MKKYLIINHHSPLDDLYTEESLELVLSIASLENEVSVLLLQNAVFQLLTKQQCKLANRNLLDQTLDAFELFGLKNIYVEDASFKQIKKLKLTISPNINIINFSLANLNDLYNQHDIILFF